MYFLLIFITAVLLSAVFTFLIKKISLKYNILDRPDSERKIHKKPIPLLGGAAIFLSFFLILFFVKDRLLAGNLDIYHWLGFFAGACFLMLGGFLDDKYNLAPGKQIIFPILAILAIIIAGVEIEKITNPIGGFFYFNKAFLFISLSDIFIFLWLLGMMYTTKILDGLDGLVSGVVMIGAVVIFIFTMTSKYYQPDIGLAALVLAGACLGFLVFNWHPAKIFLGEGGSLLLGFILGVLAIISGGKVAIALLVIGIPIIDLAWTILRRLIDKKNPFSFADRKHLHFRFLDLGFSVRQTVLIFYAFAVIFGLIALLLQSRGKILALGILCATMVVIVVKFSYLDKKTNK